MNDIREHFGPAYRSVQVPEATCRNSPKTDGRGWYPPVGNEYLGGLEPHKDRFEVAQNTFADIRSPQRNSVLIIHCETLVSSERKDSFRPQNFVKISSVPKSGYPMNNTSELRKPNEDRASLVSAFLTLPICMNSPLRNVRRFFIDYKTRIRCGRRW
jgi:hypothetical protein